MQPTLMDGDIVIYKPINKDDNPPKIGSIVVAEHPLDPKTLIIKRVHKINDFGLELRGDNDVSIDSRQFGTISLILLRGVVEEVIHIDK